MMVLSNVSGGSKPSDTNIRIQHTLIQEIQLVADRTRVHLMNPSPAPAPPSF